jgi:hypothetical protein
MTNRFFLSVTVSGTLTKLTGTLMTVGFVGVCVVLGDVALGGVVLAGGLG